MLAKKSREAQTHLFERLNGEPSRKETPVPVAKGQKVEYG